LCEYQIRTKTWAKVEVCGYCPTGRSFHQLNRFENLLIVFGGTNGCRQNDMFVISLEKQKKELDEKAKVNEE